MDLRGKVIVITGASSGIGRAIALSMTSHGTRLVLTARRADKLEQLRDEITAQGGTATVVTGDITRASTAREVTDAALKAYGTIDVLVNNAGYAPPMSLVDMPEDIWDVTLNTCLKSVYLMTRAVLPTMLAKGAGSIVQMSSVAGKNGYANRTAYCAAKWGMQGFTEALRAEVGEAGIRVHTIHPGAVATDWWARTDDPQPERVLDRMMTADDVAQAVVWLLSRPEHMQINEIELNSFRSAWAE